MKEEKIHIYNTWDKGVGKWWKLKKTKVSIHKRKCVIFLKKYLDRASEEKNILSLSFLSIATEFLFYSKGGFDWGWLKVALKEGGLQNVLWLRLA